MAHGISCKHCGWQEVDHNYRSDFKSAGSKTVGFEYSLKKCPGYESGDPDTEARLNAEGAAREREDEAITRRVRGIPDGL